MEGLNRAPDERVRAPSWAIAAAAALGAVAFLWAGWKAVSGSDAMLGEFAFAIAAGVAGFFVGRRDVTVIHRAIRRALEGHLEPAQALGRWRHGRAVADYNTLARRLSSLLDEMERSQLWTIAERNRVDAILQSLPCVMLVVDDDLFVASSNDRAEGLFGRGGTELRASNLFDLLELDDEGRELLREAFLYEQPLSNREIVLGSGESRRHFTMSVTFFKCALEAGGPCSVIMLQDVDDYRRLQQITYQSEKFVAMGRLAGGVAHELNTPLGTILGYAQLLNAGGASEAKRAQYGQAIYSEAKRCAQIIDNLLAYARRDRCVPETCDINAVIGIVIDTICNCRGNRYNVPIDVDLCECPPVLGGSGQLDIVLVNIVMNALQATSGSAREPRVLVASRVEGASAIVTVTDNGPGIAAGLHNRIFEPFFTTKGGNKGTGLGLAISQSIAVSVGGALHCDTTFRGGARFVLKLPLAQESSLGGTGT